MVQLQAVKTLPKAKGKDHYVKFQLTVPLDVVNELGWNAGDEIRFQVEGKAVRLVRLVEP